MKQEFKVYIVGFITAVALFTFLHVFKGAVVGNQYIADEGIFVPQTASATVRGVFAAPERLRIPAISVDALVQHVGLTAKKAMANPTNFTDVGWYKYGTIPGERGSAVMAGHVDNGLGLNGVFKNLKNLKKGDDIYVLDEEGTQIHFKVTAINHYKYDEAPAEDIFNESSKNLLRLITCGGKWLKEAKTYDERVVVTAERVSDTLRSSSATLKTANP